MLISGRIVDTLSPSLLLATQETREFSLHAAALIAVLACRSPAIVRPDIGDGLSSVSKDGAEPL